MTSTTSVNAAATAIESSPPLAPARRLARALGGHRELALVLTLTLVGAAMRLWQLGDLPFGYHNDEGNVTLDAQRILDNGWVGPYSRLANGYPIAVNYFVAPFIKVFGATAFGVRLPMAVLGIATIPLAYYTFRLAAGWRVAACATFLLVTSLWHLHFSRVGFPVIGWPVVELGSLLALQLGLRSRRWPYFIVSGVLAGLGVWVYPSATLFAFAMGAVMGAWALVQLARLRNVAAARDFLLVGILGASMLLGAWPMISYQRSHQVETEGRLRATYVFGSERRDRCLKTPAAQRDQACRWAVAESFNDKAVVIREKTQLLWDSLTTKPAPDAADGMGARPPVGKLAMYLAIVGLVIAALRFRNLAMGISALAIPLIALGSILTIDGQFRRVFGMMPLIALFGGVTLGVAWEWADRQHLVLRAAALALVGLALAMVSVGGLRFYYADYGDTQVARFVFYPELRRASEYVGTLGHPYVYWYNSRAPLGHETRRVLASNMAGGEDRATQWTKAEDRDVVRYDLRPEALVGFPATREPDGAVFVFMDAYVDGFDIVAQKYPGGVEAGRWDAKLGRWDYRAYYLPADLLQFYARQESISYPVQLPQE
jgi:4-amino-4-deoxy-L-arabinose transferase-like glycosyltransferase